MLTEVADAQHFKVAGFAALGDDFFNGLTLKALDGEQAGESAAVSDFTGSTGAFVAGAGLSAPPEVGDQVAVVPATSQDAWLWFWNVWGAIWSELLAQSGTGGLLALRDVRKEAWQRGAQEAEAEDYIQASWLMKAGR